MPQNQFDGIGYLASSDDLQDSLSLNASFVSSSTNNAKSTTSYDFAQSSFQAQDHMDILQEDYPSIL